MQTSRGTAVAAIAAMMALVSGCGSSSSDQSTASTGGVRATTADSPAATDQSASETDPTPASDASESVVTQPAATDVAVANGAGLAAGPVTYIALGDSLTAGDGDDTYQGYVGVIAAAIGTVAGREDVSVLNYGASGWDSTMMVDGQDGAPGQLGQAVDEARAAVAAGRAVLATVLIGSNDMWYVYEYGPPEGTPAENEDAAVETYRANLDRTVQALTDAGAVVVVGLPDDQSLRPAVADMSRLQYFLPDVTAEEVQQMAALAKRLDRVAQEVAAEHGALTVETDAPFWSDQSTMADDGIHPNKAGYAVFADLWLATIRGLL